jgi:outer membrane biosynthesis protein TonB
MAPYAYRLGVISGMTKIRIVVEKNGRLSAMEVLDTVGHESLHEASQAALKAFAPYAALPPNFPEPNLVIILSLHYPAWRR